MKRGMGWNIPDSWQKIHTIDMHTEGEPLRIILDGFPDLPGRTILEKRKYYRENFDHLRKALMWEPRGHADMYGCILTTPEREDSDFGVIFTHNEGYSTMCGHGILAVTKAALETGLVSGNSVKIDSPAGLIRGFGEAKEGKVKSVWFQNVASYVALSGGKIEVPGLGGIEFDIAFGGAYYAFVDADKMGLELVADNYREIIRIGMEIKKAVMELEKIIHPFEEELGFLYGTIFVSHPHDPKNHSRNVCVFADGEVDRSPTGTGVSARAAIHYAKNEIKIGEEIVIESILGTTFGVSVVEEREFGPYRAVIPKVRGNAYFTGEHVFVIDPEDPLREGFILR